MGRPRPRPSAIDALALPLSFLAALVASAVAVWCVSALVLFGGASTPVAVLAAAIVALIVPLGVVLWKDGPPHVARPRGLATVAGWNIVALAFVALAVPDPLGIALREHGWMFAARAFGEDDGLTRAASMLSHEVADVVDPPRDQPPVDVRTAAASIHVEVELSGPGGSVSQQYLWDTGATYTTLTRKTAAQLGVAVPEDAPVVELDTAAGPRRSALVVLPTIRIGGHAVHGIAASICDTCAHDDISGLVGLNAMRHFVSKLDGPAGRLQLVAAPDVDRTHDITPFVSLAVEGTPNLAGDHANWRVAVHNTGPRLLTAVVPRVEFRGGQTLLGSEIESLAPGQTAWSRVKGRAGETASGEFTLTLHRAAW